MDPDASNEPGAARVLCVDDLEDNLLALEALLTKPGLQLSMAQSGPEALELLLVNDYALALLDVQMPEMNGYELAELMHGTERTRVVPVIFITAGTRDGNTSARGYEVGAVDFLFKPVEPLVLRRKVDVFAEMWRLRRRVTSLERQLAAARNVR
jgi:CheY-like chemotaxis protein